MADGLPPSPRAKAHRSKADEGLPLHPVVESLSAAFGRYLARVEFERQQAAEDEEKAA